MKITILATGSRGDVQPFVAVGFGLQQAGHEVTFVTNAHFETWVHSYGLNVRPVHWNAQAALQSEQGQRMVQSGRILETIRYFLQEAPKHIAQLQLESWAACQDAEILFYSLLSSWGYDIAEKLKIPGILGLLHPLIPTRSFPTQLLRVNLGGPLNLMTHYFTEQAFWQVVRRPTNTFRRQVLGLARLRFPETLFSVLRRQRCPLLCSLSPTVIARPPDWPEWVQMKGYWFLPAPPGWQAPADLVNFIRRGPAPVYVGFGSMTNQAAVAVGRLVVQALQLSGQRGVLVRGWGSLGIGEVADDIFFLDEAPHDWLFPQMVAVVHHGGVGTTAAGLRAGVPAVIVPHMQDQPYWGQRVYDMGVGPRPIPYSQLTAENLAQSITLAVRSQAIRERAEQMGQKIRREDGVGQAIEVFDHYVRPGRH
ncbi:MAG: glycosyltransferase [Anaerolineae bacterium]|nr:glycosyltransferase [Anaerolineae bacterium]